jgi:hypothetical protein
LEFSSKQALGFNYIKECIQNYSPKKSKEYQVALKILLNGLLDTVKASIGLCTSARDLWLKLEKMYQIKNEDIEDILSRMKMKTQP